MRHYSEYFPCVHFVIDLRIQVAFSNLESSEFCKPELHCYMSIVQFERGTRETDFHKSIHKKIKKITQAHLVSHSFGTVVQLEFYSFKRDVNKMALTNPVPFHLISKLPRPARRVLPDT